MDVGRPDFNRKHVTQTTLRLWTVIVVLTRLELPGFKSKNTECPETKKGYMSEFYNVINFNII